MSHITVEFRNFHGAADCERHIISTQKDFAHAAIAAGRNWHRYAINAADRADRQGRTNDIRSIVDTSRGGAVCVTAHYRGLGSSEKRVKSFRLGNAICALVADKEQRIPWLVDLEKLNHHYRVAFLPGLRRADFIGRTPSGLWYAFEVKCRSKRPSQKDFIEWKIQARMVSRVNGRPLAASVVSATFVHEDDSIRAIWEDPPAGDNNNIEVSDTAFFSAYYNGILDLVDTQDKFIEVGGQRLAHLSELGLYLGIHPEVRTAIMRQDFLSVIGFAARQYDAQRYSGLDNDGEMQLFPDGLLLQLDSNWMLNSTY